MAQTAAQLVGPCLEKICEVASGRKYTKLRHEAKSLLSNLEEALRPVTVQPGAGEAAGPQRQDETVSHVPEGEQDAGVADSVQASVSADTEENGEEKVTPPRAGEEEAAEDKDTAEPLQVIYCALDGHYDSSNTASALLAGWQMHPAQLETPLMHLAYTAGGT